MLSPSADAVEPLRRKLIKYAYQRRDTWPSREHAYQNLKSRKRTESWDPRVLDLYIVLHSLTRSNRIHHLNNPVEIWTPESLKRESLASTLR